MASPDQAHPGPSRFRRLLAFSKENSLAVTTLLVAFLVPTVALINSCSDRSLEKKRSDSEITIRYLELIIRNYENKEQRRTTLGYLKRALAPDAPDSKELMFDWVTEQWSSLEQSDQLYEEITTVRQEEELKSQQIAFVRSQSTSGEIDKEEAKNLVAQLEAARLRDQQRISELTRERDEALARANVAEPVKLEPLDDPLSRYFEETSTPEEEEQLLRSLNTLCTRHRGKSSFIYLSPSEPAVSCSYMNTSIVLDASSLRPISRPRPIPPEAWMGIPGTEWLRQEICGGIGPLFGMPTREEALCIQNGKGVLVTSFI